MREEWAVILAVILLIAGLIIATKGTIRMIAEKINEEINKAVYSGDWQNTEDNGSYSYNGQDIGTTENDNGIQEIQEGIQIVEDALNEIPT